MLSNTLRIEKNSVFFDSAAAPVRPSLSRSQRLKSTAGAAYSLRPERKKSVKVLPGRHFVRAQHVGFACGKTQQFADNLVESAVFDLVIFYTARHWV